MASPALDVAAKVARRYARRVWWADADDLQQEATTAALKAETTWDPAPGVPLEAYVWRACALHLRTYLWRQSSPVTETWHRLSTLRGVHRATLDELQDHATEKDTFDLVREKQWVESVREQLYYLISEEREIIMRVLLGDERPEKVAAETGLPVRSVYKLTRGARAVISKNALLHHLLKTK